MHITNDAIMIDIEREKFRVSLVPWVNSGLFGGRTARPLWARERSSAQ